MTTKVSTAEGINEVEKKINEFVMEGFDRQQIYDLAHTDAGTDLIARQTNTEKIGLSEEGVFSVVTNIFRSHGDRLRAKLKSMDLSEMDARCLETELDEGKILVMASNTMKH